MYTFLANIELALNKDESEDDITAALTAPKPINCTNGGVKYCNTIGNTNDLCSLLKGKEPGNEVSSQAVEKVNEHF